MRLRHVHTCTRKDLSLTLPAAVAGFCFCECFFWSSANFLAHVLPQKSCTLPSFSTYFGLSHPGKSQVPLLIEGMPGPKGMPRPEGMPPLADCGWRTGEREELLAIDKYYDY